MKEKQKLLRRLKRILNRQRTVTAGDGKKILRSKVEDNC